MAKLSMKSMLWLGKPEKWQKDWRSVSLLVEAGTSWPDNCPCLVAAWDKDIAADALLSIPPAGEAGLCVFQTPESQAAAGISRGKATLHYRARGSWCSSSFPLSGVAEKAWLRFTRKGEEISFSWSPDKEAFFPLLSFTLPGAGRSYSFGWYWAAPDGEDFEGTVEDFTVLSLGKEPAV